MTLPIVPHLKGDKKKVVNIDDAGGEKTKW
jgi:hypothetical protein